MKLIFVTGGVISGLGKGITAASIGRLLKSSGYTVSMMKMDPYLQVDAGTMSPYEHGEVFVTDDGGEIDLDFGHYERFVGVKLAKQNSITTGKVFLDVINKERKGEYLGQTVQVIPHVINEIKAMVQDIATDSDVTIIEIGGTVGDIEGPHFIETMRQLRFDLGVENTFFVHVVPIIRLTHSGEYKTKAIQHSVVKLREVGISPDCLVVRTPESLDEGILKKLSLFGGLPKERIVQALDLDSIYKIPQMFHEQGLTNAIQDHLFKERQTTDLAKRRTLCESLTSPHIQVNIAIAGKYTHFDDCYLSVIESLRHAGVAADTKVKIVRLDTCDYEDQDREGKLKQTIGRHNIHGILVPGGFGSRGVEGMINVAHYAMKNKLPYMGICLGMQVAVIAHARYNCNLSEAHSTEFTQETSHPVVHLMENQKNIHGLGGTMRLGAYPAVLQDNSTTLALYKKRYAHRMVNGSTTHERHRHRYEVNPFYHETLQQYGMKLAGLSPDGQLVEFIEFEEHPYFLATQAHPEFLSQLDNAHPLFIGLVQSSKN